MSAEKAATRSDEVFTSLVCLDTLRPTHPSPHFTSGSQSLTQHLVVPPHIGFYTPQICVSPSSPQRANMPQTADPIAQGEDVNTWLRGMTESLTPKTCELLLFLIIILILRRLLTHDSSQNNNHEELVKITSSLSYAFTAQLHLSDKHITHLQEELTRAQSRIDKLEVKVQDQLKAPNEREQETMEQVKKLQAALGAAQCDQQQANAAQKDLVNRLQYAEQLLEKARKNIRDKNAEISALEDHLERYGTEIDNLTQHLDDANDELCMVRKELKQAYELKQEPRREKHPSASQLLSRTDSHVQELASNERSEGPQPKTSPAFATELFPVTERTDPIQADLQAAHGMTIKDLSKLSNNISKFNPNSKESHDIQAHLQDIDFHLEMRPHVTDRDRLYLLRATSSPEVRNFLDRQPSHTKSNYQLLREVLIKEFTDPESEYGLLTALETKQGRQETPQAYYNRLRQAYFGAHSKPDLEEDVNFKSLFLRNLHPGVSRHLGVMACPHSMTIQQLRDLTQKAYNKQKMASKKGNKTSTLLNSVTKDSSLALDDTQWHHNTRVLHQEHRERDPYFHDSYQPSRCEKPWDKPRFSEIPKERINWKPNWMYKANQTARPRTTGVGKQRQNPPQHHSNIHGAKYPQEQHSLLSEDMEQVMKELKEFLENQLDTND
ncbi:Nucleoprotein TPR [Labeo rohita]|uniref:Nucleoprotein TPR n=1 Tax=Labeo rohita TaxID=84645 RepID=A0ABQ8L0U3_LABRO|nr:Nucleoprotein TPR [Labeo rohita]